MYIIIQKYNNMLTIKGSTQSDKIIIAKESIRKLLENTKLSYLSDINDLSSDSLITFEDILINANVFQENNMDPKTLSMNANIFKDFLNKKVTIPQMPSGLIDNMVENILSHSIIDKFRLLVFPSIIPNIIRDLELADIYEQLFVYEYIYMSENHTLHKKLDIIVENNYEFLLSMIEDCSLEISMTSTEAESIDQSKEELLKLRHRYYDDIDNGKHKITLFNRFVDLHANWLTYDIYDLNEMDDRSIRIADMIEGNDTTNTIMPKLTETTSTEILTYLSIYNTHTPCISIEELCHLNRYYQTSPIVVGALLDVLLPLLKISTLADFKNDDTDIRKYKSLDLIVRLMEDDDKVISILSKNTQERIVSRWLRMSSPTYHCFRHCKQYPYQHYDDAIDNSHAQYHYNLIRKIKLSKTIKNIISNMCVTFDEMGYILATDNLEMFKIICKNLEFKIIQPIFYKYLPLNILSYIIDHSLKANNVSKLSVIPTFTLNIYDIIERSTDQIKHSLNLLHSYFDKEYNVEIISISDRYDYVDSLYIVMYLDYLAMLINNPKNILNFITILSSIKNIKTNLSNYYLDMVILKTVIDNNNIMCNDTNTISSLASLLNGIIKQMSTDTVMINNGPNFTEIFNELIFYGIQNVDYLRELGDIQDNAVDINDIISKKTYYRTQRNKKNNISSESDISNDVSSNDIDTDTDTNTSTTASTCTDTDTSIDISTYTESDDNESDESESFEIRKTKC